ncbi:MAG: hypothetical protein TECD_00416 [Hyphomicrobiaceae bacterium hypho_1]
MAYLIYFTMGVNFMILCSNTVYGTKFYYSKLLVDLKQPYITHMPIVLFKNEPHILFIAVHDIISGK